MTKFSTTVSRIKDFVSTLLMTFKHFHLEPAKSLLMALASHMSTSFSSGCSTSH